MASVPRTRGLLNREYTCYVNVVLQILARSPDVVRWSRQYTHDGEGPAEEYIRCILRDTIVKMRKKPLTTPFIPQNLLNWIRQHNPEFVAGVQSDSHELLMFLMTQTGLDYFTHDETEKTLEDVSGYVEEKTEIVPTVGLGTHHVLAVSESSENLSIKNLLNEYISVRNSRICGIGDRRICIERTFLVLPKMLMMKLDRFAYVNNQWSKNRRPCTIDSEIAIMTSDNEKVRYTICGFINHAGPTPSEGHYEANVIDNGKWFAYSDEDVERKSITTEDTYLVFYKQANAEEMPDPGSEFEQNIICDQQEVESMVENSFDVQSETSDEERWWEDCDPELQAAVRKWRSDLSNKIHLECATKLRQLIICLPKTCKGSSFKDAYASFMNSEETAFYSLSLQASVFLKKRLRDPLIKQKYNVYIQDVGTKFGKKSNSLWVAENATTYILNTLFGDRSPRMEFIFDLNPSSIVPSFILRNWQKVRRNVMAYVSQCLKTQDLFCLEGCSRKCTTENVSYHRSIRNMTLLPPSDEVELESALHKWRFADGSSSLNGHPLKMLLKPSEVNFEQPLTPQVTEFLRKCELKRPKPYSVYFLMVVDSKANHTPADLHHMWKQKTAKFAVYVGLTRNGPFRKDHIFTKIGSKPSSVARILTDNSTVYLVTSKEYPTYKEGALAEAHLIKEEPKTGIAYNFEVLNKKLPIMHFFEASAAAKKSYERFMHTGKRPFRFLNEPYKQSDEEVGILQRFLVSQVIRKPLGQTFACRDPTCFKSYERLQQLQSHESEHLVKRFQCKNQNCERSFSKAEYLRTHKFTHLSVGHGKTFYSKRNGGKRANEEKSFKCDYDNCGKQFHKLVHLRAHRRTHGIAFQCQYHKCGKIFKQQVELWAHQKSHEGKAYTCKFQNCGRKFKRKTYFRAHLQRHAEKSLTYDYQSYSRRDKQFQNFSTHTLHKTNNRFKKPFACDRPNCNKSYKLLSSLQRHQRSHLGKRYFCDYPDCRKSYVRHNALQEHQRIHTGNTFDCDYPECGLKFTGLRFLQQHTLTHDASFKGFVCEHPNCSKTFKVLLLLQAHQRTHLRKTLRCKYPNCDKRFKTMHALRKHQKSHKGQRFPCDYPKCGKTFNNLRYLRLHTPTHDASFKGFECDHPNCNKTFKVLSTLQTHKRTHTDKKYVCDYPNCDKSYKLLSSIQRHKKSHLGGRFVCDYENCDKSYADKYSLQEHQRIHTGETFDCNYPECGRKFTVSWRLQQHKQTHDASFEGFECDFPNCSKAFKVLSSLQTHKRTHSDTTFVCDHSKCDKKFNTLDYLRRHQLIHLGENSEKPYVCDRPDCDKSYYRLSLLKKHQRSHLGEIFVCEHPNCGKTYKNLQNLRIHRKDHTD